MYESCKGILKIFMLQVLLNILCFLVEGSDIIFFEVLYVLKEKQNLCINNYWSSFAGCLSNKEVLEWWMDRYSFVVLKIQVSE